MTKQEAIIEMMAGKKVTHRLLGPDEWITIVNDDTQVGLKVFADFLKGL